MVDVGARKEDREDLSMWKNEDQEEKGEEGRRMRREVQARKPLTILVYLHKMQLFELVLTI